MKKLKDPASGVAKFFERVDRLGRRLGPVLFQLPPGVGASGGARWEVNCKRLEAFLAALPRGHRYAFELRDLSWHVPQRGLLHLRHCWFPFGNRDCHRLHLRLDGPGGAYQGSYARDKLDEWAARIHEWRQQLQAVYFDNDQAATAVHNARTLLGGRLLTGTSALLIVALQVHHSSDFVVDASPPLAVFRWNRAFTLCKAPLKKSTSRVRFANDCLSRWISSRHSVLPIQCKL